MLQELQQIDRLIEEGELERAQIIAKSLLQKHPTSAAAHEKMGDVARARELWEDAVEWYDLARQLHDSPDISRKLAEAKRSMQAARKGGPEPELVEDTGQGRLLWLGIATAFLTLVVVLVVIGFAQSRRTEETQQAQTDVVPPTTAPRSPGLTSPSTVRSMPTERPSFGSGATVADTKPETQATENPAQHWTATPVTGRAPRRPISTARAAPTRQAALTEPVTDHDEAVINAVSSLTWGNRPMTGRVSAMVDPYTGYAMVRVTIPTSLESNNMLEEVVAQAYRVAQATVQSDEVINTITVQMIRVTPTGERVVAFRGNTSREALAAYSERTTPDFDTLWNKLFKTVWWNPTGEETPPETTGGSSASARPTTG